MTKRTCLTSNGLPNHIYYQYFHNLTCLFNTAMLVLTIYVFYKSPRSKESAAYKLTINLQFIILFILSLLWSLILKLYPDLYDSMVYSAGYVHLTGLNCGQFYTICSFIFGNYCTVLPFSYIQRLKLVADQRDILNNRIFLNTIICLFYFLFAILQPVFFFRAYVENYDLTKHPANYTMEEINFFKAHAYVIFPRKSINTYVYMFYLVFVVAAEGSIIGYIIREIVFEVRERESVSSTVVMKYHLKVLKNLVTQTSATVFILSIGPLVITMTLFTRVNPCLIEFSIITFGHCFSVHSTLVLLLSPSTRKTVLTIIKWKKVTKRFTKGATKDQLTSQKT